MHLHSEIPKGGFGIPITNVQMDWFCLQSPSRGAVSDCATGSWSRSFWTLYVAHAGLSLDAPPQLVERLIVLKS
jgi:hypothetical protein